MDQRLPRLGARFGAAVVFLSSRGSAGGAAFRRPAFPQVRDLRNGRVRRHESPLSYAGERLDGRHLRSRRGWPAAPVVPGPGALVCGPGHPGPLMPWVRSKSPWFRRPSAADLAYRVQAVTPHSRPGKLNFFPPNGPGCLFQDARDVTHGVPDHHDHPSSGPEHPSKRPRTSGPARPPAPASSPGMGCVLRLWRPPPSRASDGRRTWPGRAT